MGRKLAALLNRLIDAKATDARPRSDVIGAMADGAGIDAGTVNQILDASIDCPPLARLEGFARVLDESVERLKSAAGEDGCKFPAEETERMAFVSELSLSAGAEVPEWIHLLPAGLMHTIEGDARGPFKIPDMEKVAAQTMAAAGGRLPIDQDHATDLVGKVGGATAPARGWIVELQSRDDGLWGRVEWTKAGTELLKDRAYRHISPVIKHTKDGIITRLLRAALTNDPALRELTSLNNATTNEELMDFMEKLRKALGLPEDADEAAIMEAISTMLAGKTDDEGEAERMSAQIGEIATAAGLDAGAKPDAILAAVKSLATGSGDETKTVAALQAELADVTTRFNTLNTKVATDAATAIVDSAIEAGTVGVKPLREHYIKRAVDDPDGVKTELANMPKVGGDPVIPATRQEDKDGKPRLQPHEVTVAAQLGLSADDYATTLAAEREQKEIA